jgi:hypothetical protein
MALPPLLRTVSPSWVASLQVLQTLANQGVPGIDSFQIEARRTLLRGLIGKETSQERLNVALAQFETWKGEIATAADPVADYFEWYQTIHTAEYAFFKKMKIYREILNQWIRLSLKEAPTRERLVDVICETCAALKIPTNHLEIADWQSVFAEQVLFSMPRYLATLDNASFERHRPWIETHFPVAPLIREGLRQVIPWRRIQKELDYPADWKGTTIFFGPSLREVSLIQQARKGKVVLVDQDLDKLQDLRSIFGDNRGELKLILSDFNDPRFLNDFQGADRVFLLYHDTAFRAFSSASRLLKAGGKLIYQHLCYHPDWENEYFADPLPQAAEEFRTILSLKDVPPILRTTSALRYPAGNIFQVMERI